MAINSITSVSVGVQEALGSATAKKGGADFAKQLQGAIQRVDDAQHTSADALRDLASGQDSNLHGTIMALEQADISIRAAASVRDKVVSAYEQIINMAI